MKIVIYVILTLLQLNLSSTLYSSVQAAPLKKVRILLIPLDNRPPCLQFTQKMGLIGNAQVVQPPDNFLGNFTTPGQSDKIVAWLLKQNLKSFNAAIISLDMIGADKECRT